MVPGKKPWILSRSLEVQSVKEDSPQSKSASIQKMGGRSLTVSQCQMIFGTFVRF